MPPRRNVPVSQGKFICVKINTGYLDVALNGNVLLVAFLDESRNAITRKHYRLGEVTRKHLHDGRGWNLSLLLLISEM